MVYLLFLALFGSTVSMSFYCRNTYLYWEYLIPLVTVILSHRALLRTGESPHQVVSLRLRNYRVEEIRSGGRGEGGLLSRACGLHWAQLDCPSFPNEGCTQRWSSLSAVAHQQDHCRLGEMSCWNGQYLWHKLTWGLNLCSSVVAPRGVGLKANKSKLTLTLDTAGNPPISCSVSVWRDKGLMPSDLLFFPGCNVHSLFLRCECTLV